MNDKAYNQLVRYAQACLPKSAFLEATDIVSEAFLNVGGKDGEELRKAIRRLAHEQKGATSGFVPFDKAHFKDRALVETSQVCKRCGREKSPNDFGIARSHNSLVEYRRQTCNACREKQDRERIKASPERQHKRNKAKRLKNPNSWEATLLRIKGQLTIRDWTLLEHKLAEGGVLFDSLLHQNRIPVRRWTHKEVSFLEEFAETMTTEQLSKELGRTSQDVQDMIKGLGIEQKQTRIRTMTN